MPCRWKGPRARCAEPSQKRCPDWNNKVEYSPQKILESRSQSRGSQPRCSEHFSTELHYRLDLKCTGSGMRYCLQMDLGSKFSQCNAKGRGLLTLEPPFCFCSPSSTANAEKHIYSPGSLALLHQKCSIIFKIFDGVRHQAPVRAHNCCKGIIRTWFVISSMGIVAAFALTGELRLQSHFREKTNQRSTITTLNGMQNSGQWWKYSDGLV